MRPQEPPFVFKERTKPTDALYYHDAEKGFYYYGYIVDLMLRINETLDFEFTMTEPPDGIYGTLQENGSWNGMISELQEDVRQLGDTGLATRCTVWGHGARYTLHCLGDMGLATRCTVSGTWDSLYAALSRGHGTRYTLHCLGDTGLAIRCTLSGTRGSLYAALSRGHGALYALLVYTLWGHLSHLLTPY